MSIDISTLPARHEDAVPAVVRYPDDDYDMLRWVSQKGKSTRRDSQPGGWGDGTVTALLVEGEWVEVTYDEWHDATRRQYRVTGPRDCPTTTTYYVHRDEYVKTDPDAALVEKVLAIRSGGNPGSSKAIIAAVREHDQRKGNA